MSTVVKDLGAVSAYAYAVEKGYTGTEAEFAELMADYAEVGQRAEDAAESALNSKTAAQTAAQTATNKASEAAQAAQTATTKATEAQADADAAALDASQAMSAASTATSKATEATTAAATAVSSKDAAVSANTAAQSAKTAAQTAQQGAETARDAVQSSAAQITTNAEDITQLKEDILAVQNSVKVSRPRIINGSLSTTTGERVYTLSQVNSYCITPDLLHVAKGSVITKSAQTTMRIYEYSKDDEFISYSTISTGTTKYTFSADKYVRLFFLVSGSPMNAKTVFDNVVFDLILLNYEKPGIISTFMGLTGNGGTFEQYVESGEACIIQFPNSEVMAIDFHKDALSNNYQYYRDSLALRGVRRVDYIVITHYHDDHVGLFAKALEYRYINIDGAKAYLPQYITSELAEAREWETYKERQDTIIQTLQEHNCTIVYPVDGDVLKIDDAVITWYNCDHSIYSDTSGDYYSTNYNDWSLCFNFRYENTIVNYSSDLGPIGQRAMAGKMPKASILKAMHHGWDNGVNNLIPAFINNVSPDMVISCNGYEHRPTAGNQQEPNMLNASSPIYSWAEANGVPAYPTCTNGNIDILINKYGYRLDGHYTRFIRNDKNWSYTDNSEHIET